MPSDVDGGRTTKGAKRPGETGLRRQALATPKAAPSGPDYARSGREGSGGDDLATQVAAQRKEAAVRLGHEGDARMENRLVGQLNPNWVEWLMFWPIGWTSLDPLPIQSWRDWLAGVAPDYYIPRVATGVGNRAQRLRALGNGQVPACAVEAFRRLALA